MLSAYPGALVLITHDEHLARAATDEVWRIEEERVALETTHLKVSSGSA